MNVLQTSCALILFVIYLGSTAMAGKCTGKWAIHACGGGNGKRSDDFLSDGEEVRDHIPDAAASRTLLSRLVRPSSDRDQEALDSAMALEPPPGDDVPSLNQRTQDDDGKWDETGREYLGDLEQRIEEKLAENQMKHDKLLAAYRLIKRIKARNVRNIW